MKKPNSNRIEKLGFVAETSPPQLQVPTRLLAVSLYQQPPGRHPGQDTPSKRPGFWQLEQGKELVELVTAGRGWIRMKEDDWKEVTPGALLWHVQGDQTIARSDWDNPFQCLALAFETPRFQGVRRTARLAWWRDLEEVGKFSRELIHWYFDGRIDHKTLLHYAYGRLLFQSQLWQRIEEHSELPLKLREAAEWMTRHCTEKFPLDAVAKMVGWSAPHLHEMFRRKLDVTPHQFVLTHRIRIAKERLAVSDEPIKQLAADCGFSTTAIFCHVFKSRIGITPLAYRKQARDWVRQ